MKPLIGLDCTSYACYVNVNYYPSTKNYSVFSFTSIEETEFLVHTFSTQFLSSFASHTEMYASYSNSSTD